MNLTTIPTGISVTIEWRDIVDDSDHDWFDVDYMGDVAELSFVGTLVRADYRRVTVALADSDDGPCLKWHIPTGAVMRIISTGGDTLWENPLRELENSSSPS
jgi:hypothetical protein